MLKPSLIVYIVSFDRDAQDRTGAEYESVETLGRHLYGRLTRPTDDPLAFGAGVPVRVAARPEHVDLESAEIVMVVPVLGAQTYLIKRRRQAALDDLNEWSRRLGRGHVVPVPLTQNWRAELDSSQKIQWLMTQLFGTDKLHETVNEILLALARLLLSKHRDLDPLNDQAKLNVQLFVSHAKADLNATNKAAEIISTYIKTNTTGQAFFDKVSILVGHDAAKQLLEAAGSGMFIAVRGDAYSSRVWCQRELLTAKSQGIPTLTVDVVRVGEARTLPYGGNGPTMRWNDEPGDVLSQAMVEWVRASLFELEGERLKDQAFLPDNTAVLARPPELLDFAQGRLGRQSGRIPVLYPDPELSVPEREVLVQAHPRLHLMTPSTMYRETLGPSDAGTQAPLNGKQVAISISGSPDIEQGPRGLTEHHVMDAASAVLRTVISAGAKLGYGGLFKLDQVDQRSQNYASLINDLVVAYNEISPTQGENLNSYIGCINDLEDVPSDTPINALFMSRPEESLLYDDETELPAERRPIITRASLFEKGTDGENTLLRHRLALCFCDMRRVMAQMTDTRVCLGGQPLPKGRKTDAHGQEVDPKDGYGGAYPGIVEEAWWTLKVGKPLYVLGAFGGGAGLVAELAQNKPIPIELQDVELRRENEAYGLLVDRFRADPDRELMGLPATADEIAEEIQTMVLGHLSSDAAALAWNGLNREDNQRLFSSEDPSTLAALVLKGMLRKAEAEAEGKLRIELVNGDVRSARQLDVLAVGVFENVEVGGAGRALDETVSGRVRAARASGHSLVSMTGDGVDADWLYLANLGSLGRLDELSPRIRRAAREVAEVCARHQFGRLGVVTFGGANARDPLVLAAHVENMLHGFRSLRGKTTVVWHETNRQVFEGLRRILRDAKIYEDGQATDPLEVSLSIRRPVSAEPVVPLQKELVIDISQPEEGKLRLGVLPPAGTALAGSKVLDIPDGLLERFATGTYSSTPKLDTLTQWGTELHTLILENDGFFAREMRESGARWVVIVDPSASRLPIELLQAPIDGASPFVPSLEFGVVRRLGVNVPHAKLLPRPVHTGALGVALVVNPTEDLSSASEEADAVQQELELMGAQVQRVDGKNATVEGVRAMLQSPENDVLHYIGHAFYSGPGPEDSGLELADGDLTVGTLGDIHLQPRVAFVNACQSARLRSRRKKEASADPTSFAEILLRAGVEAYVGTTWLVKDVAAAEFAAEVYRRLAAGSTVAEAVRNGRKQLHSESKEDWGNYVLYGSADFSLLSPSAP